MKVCVCIPAQQTVLTTFMVDMTNMFFYSRNKGIDITFNQMNGCYLDLLRNQLVTSGLATNPDFIMMLDSDMRFPANTMERLIAADKEVIGCNYARRMPPFDPIACTIEDPNKRLDPKTVSGVGRVSILPTGIMMIKPDIFKRIQYPWFENIWRADKKLIGEDVVFCAKVQEQAKTFVHCDHDLSREVAHSGQFDFRFEHL